MSSVPVPYAGALDTRLCPRGEVTNIKKLGRKTELELVMKVTTGLRVHMAAALQSA
jgi:hypothetical protein